MRQSLDLIRDLVPYHHVRYRAPCNLQCFYCYERPHGRVDLDEVAEAIEESLRTARAAGYELVVFGAGELPLLRGWEQAVRRATEMGFRERTLLTNLVLLEPALVDRLVDAGITGVTGTVFSLDDEDAYAASGRRGVFTRQLEGLRLVAAEGGLRLSLHVMLTRPVAADLVGNLVSLRDRIDAPLQSVMVSAIEPVSEAVRNHPLYTDGLDLPWEALFEQLAREGIDLVVQNIPACLLGDFARRSFFFRKRVARVLRGWPVGRDLVAQVNAAEILYRRVPPSGNCVGCPLIAVCHRFFEYPKTRRVEGVDDEWVVRRLLAQEQIDADPKAVVRALRWIDSRAEPDDNTPPRG